MKKWAVLIGIVSGTVVLSGLSWLLWSVALGTLGWDEKTPTSFDVVFFSSMGLLVLAFVMFIFDDWWEGRL